MERLSPQLKDIGPAMVWRMRALLLAKRLRAADPYTSTTELAERLSAQVEGAPGTATVTGRIKAWERTGALPVQVRRRA